MAGLEFAFPLSVSVVGPPALAAPFRTHLALYNPDFAFPRVVHSPHLDRYFWCVNGAQPWPAGRPEYYSTQDLLTAEVYYQWLRVIDPQRWPKIVADQRRRHEAV